jgi:hypothetical protein
MDNLILSQIPAPQLLDSIRAIIRAELDERTRQEDEKLISPAEAVKVFVPAITKLTLKHWTDDGLLNMIRIGGRTYYRKSEILQAGKELKKYKNKKI